MAKINGNNIRKDLTIGQKLLLVCFEPYVEKDYKHSCLCISEVLTIRWLDKVI